MTKQHIALATLPASLIFMILAYLWPTSSPALAGWTDEDSKRHSEIAAKVHELAHGHHHVHGPPQPGVKPETAEEETRRKAEHEEFKKKFAEGETRLERSRQSGSFMVKLLTGLSVLTFCAGIGGIVYLTILEQQKNQK